MKYTQKLHMTMKNILTCHSLFHTQTDQLAEAKHQLSHHDSGSCCVHPLHDADQDRLVAHRKTLADLDLSVNGLSV